MSGNKKFRILIADDNELNQKIVRDMLAPKGYETVSVRTGPEAIRSLKSQVFDLVIMDCLMPGMDGFATASAIRNGDPSDFDPEIPILAVTALATASDREKCFDAGMDEYMSKPFRAELLYSKLDSLLNKSTGRGNRTEDSDSRAAHEPELAQILRSMADVIVSDARQWQNDLRAETREDAFESIRFLAHRIRGTADIVGCQALSLAAARLEHAALEGAGTSIPELSQTVIGELDGLVEFVKGYAKKERFD